MKKTKPKKLLTVLLTLYLALSIVPITAYAGVTDVTGGTTTNTYSHFYHTKVETTAQVTIKDADGNVIETTEVTKSGDFVEGNVSSDAVQAEIKRIDDEINAQYSSRGSITIENRNGNMVFDHFESSNIITSGDNILVGDLDALENAASGSSVNKNLVVHEYQVYHITYDLIVQENSQPTNTIPVATIENAKFNYQPGDAPQATAQVTAADAEKYEIDYECWQQFENNEPVAAWYSDNGSHGSLPTITEFESGKRYVYFLMLKPKDGYSFNSETTVTVNGESVKSSLSGEYLYVPAVKTITPTKQNTVITSAAVENVKLDYKDGETPRTTATTAAADRDKYDILYECWGKLEKTDEYTTESVAYWYSDEDYCPSGYADLTSFDKDGKYGYSVRLEAKDGYIFSDSISADDITINGKSLPEGSYAMTLDDNRTCVVTYGMNMRTIRPLDTVKLYGATTEFYIDGDSPRFNGHSGSAYSDVAYEKWEDKDDRSIGINSDESLNGDYSQLVNSFKYGKTYIYGVAFNITDLGLEEGYRFDTNTKLCINDEEVTLKPEQVQVSDDGMTVRFNDILSMTPEAPWQKIDLVEIDGATIDFKAGDKPVFTGTVPEDSPNVLPQCEFWEGDDGSGVNSYWFWDQNYKNHIDAFESGKTYTYGVYVKAAHGYYFTQDTKLKINGKFYTYHLPEGDPELDHPDFMATLWAVTDLTITPEALQQQAIDVVEIEGATINFKTGDKPVFTGKTGDNQPYFIDHERWDTDGAGVASSEYWNNFYGDFDGNWGKRIETFESGKEYRYGVYLKLTQNGYAEGWRFDKNTKLRINGQSVDLSNKRVDVTDDELTIWFYDVLTMTPGSSAPHSHSYGTEWKYDETNHWHECECGEKADITAHTFKQIIDKEATATEKGSKHEECTVCGYKKAAVDIPKIDSHNHDYGTEWKYDSTNHWHECECDNKADITAHNFKWIIDKEATTAEKGSKHEECTVCGYKKTAVDIPAIGFGSSSDDEANKPTNTVSSESGSADQLNNTANTASPKTGNSGNIILWIALLFVSGGVFITATAVDRKKTKNK